MKRRDFLRGVVVGGAAGVLLGEEPPPAPAKAKRPNVLVIHVDQHRIDCLGAYGNADIKTPHIDALAGDGVRFNNSFCPYPVCTPSRYSLITGLYVHEHRGWTNHCTLPPGTATFPALLKQAGYKTKTVGKMHYTPTYADVGFEEMALAEQNGPGRWDDDYHRYLQRLGLVDYNDLEDQLREYRRGAPKNYWQTFGALVSNLPEKHHSTTWTADRAVETLQQWDASTPRLLMAGFIKPHHPFDPPGAWHEMYDPAKLAPLPGWTDQVPAHDLALSRGYFPNKDLTRAALRRVMAYYYATISQIDHHVGRMIAVLKKRGLYDNTLILFTADHGEFLGFHHMLLKGNYAYDPLAKVPLIVKFPHSRKGGIVSDALVSGVDLAPTILKAAGLTPAAKMKGLNLADVAQGKAERDIVFCEARGGSHVMARTRTRKLIRVSGRRKHKSLFFDLEKDPLERKDLHDDPAHRNQVRRLTEAVEAWPPKGKLLPRYLDEDAPQINQPNVPSRDRSHRPAIIAYYRKMMEKQRGT